MPIRLLRGWRNEDSGQVRKRQQLALRLCETWKDYEVSTILMKGYPKRTIQQNKALHALFNLLAEQLNEAGLDMRKTLKPGVEIPWSGRSVKEFLWRPVQKAQLNKESTTELTTVEIDKVFDTINKHLGEKFGLHVPFPSMQEMLLSQELERKIKEDNE